MITFSKHDKQKIRGGVAALLFAMLLILPPVARVSAQEDEGPASAAEVVDRIVAVVNDDVILLSELNKAMVPYEKAIAQRNLTPQAAEEMRYRTREDLLNDLIDSKLTQQKAKELGIRVEEAEVDAAVEHQKQSLLYTDEDLRRAIAEDGLTMEDFRAQIKKQILRSKLLSREVKSKTVVTTEEIEDYYEKNYDKPKEDGKQYHLRNIVMRPADASSAEEKQAVFETMQLIHKQIAEDGAPFADMARQYSQSSFAADGGDLGMFALDSMSDSLRNIIINLKAGEMSPVVETGQGYQIFYVEEILDSADISADKFADEIRQKIYEEKLNARFAEWLTQLREQSIIKRIL